MEALKLVVQMKGKEALEKLAQLYKEGAIDPEFASLKMHQKKKN